MYTFITNPQGEATQHQTTAKMERTESNDISLATVQPTYMVVNSKSPPARLVAVRYFLDRPGYGLKNSTVRLWINPPAVAQPHDVMEFLKEQKIALDGLLVEIYLDHFESFMIIESCASAGIEWDFGTATPEKHATLNVRLTDVKVGSGGSLQHQECKSGVASCNTSPLGLFAFSMTVFLETVSYLNELVPGSINEYFSLQWSTYQFFVGGVLQFVVGVFEVFRGNIYGATSFGFFGCLWMSTGLLNILQLFFAEEGTLAYEIGLEPSPYFNITKNIYVFFFALMLQVQTWKMNKLSSVLIGILAVKTCASLFTSLNVGMLWFEFVVGWILSLFSLFVSWVELTNQVYHREVLPSYKWSEEESPDELFGARGWTGTLESNAMKLRQTNYASKGMLRDAAISEGSTCGTEIESKKTF